MPVVWCLADPKLGEREVAADLLGHARDLTALPTGVVVIGDKGFAGREFERDMTELGITFVRPDRRDETRRHGNLALIRQRIESIINTAKRQLSLEHHGARTTAGVIARVAQRVLAPRRRDLAQLGHQRTGHTLPDRLRPLKIQESVI